MRKIRIYLDIPNLGSTHNIALLSEPSHRLKRVLRLKPNDLLTVFNGLGSEYSARLIEYKNNNAIIDLIKKQENTTESPLKTQLLLGISRGERMDYAIQKSVELGVNKIQPIFTRYCEVKLSGTRLDKRLQHWRGICISASEQSGRNILPDITSPLSFNEALSKQASVDTKLIFQPHAEQSLKDITIQAKAKVTLLIGPEGGLSKQECIHAEQAGFKPLQLGRRILRTETAPLAALAALQTLHGDF